LFVYIAVTVAEKRKPCYSTCIKFFITSGYWLVSRKKAFRLRTSILLTNAMALTHKQKEKVSGEVKRHEKDTCSPEYQISIFTEQIKRLTTHLKKNKKDFHSRRGLLKMVAKRKKLMTYLEKTNEEAYKKMVKTLGLD